MPPQPHLSLQQKCRLRFQWRRNASQTHSMPGRRMYMCMGRASMLGASTALGQRQRPY